MFFAVKGYAATEAGDALRSALAAAEQASASDRRFVTLASLWTHLQVTGRCREAHDAGTRMLTEAEQRGDSSHLLVGHYMSGVSVMSLGCPTEARRHFEAGTSVVDRAAGSEHVFAPGHSAAIGVRMFLCEVLVILGNLDRAVSVARQCIDMARAANHSLTLAAALSTVSRSLLRVWADTTVVNWSVEGAALAEEKGFVFYQATGKVRTGWINAKQGEPSQGAALALEGLREYIDTGARWNVPVFSLFASEAQEEAGFYDEALHTVSAALELIEATEETGQILAELLRARGNLLARSGATIDAEDNFAQAVDVARRQGAKMWELRASISLARLLCGRGSSA